MKRGMGWRMPRKVHVVTTCFNAQRMGVGAVEKNFDKAQELLSMVEGLQPDIVCLPEVFLETNLPKRPATFDMAERVIEFLSRNAKKLGSYVVASGYEVIESEVYNVAWLIDRNGDVLGRYAKHHLTMGEIEGWGLKPGPDIPVFDTDFGRIGLSICYDIGWPGLWDELGKGGAELVIWPSAYDGGFPLQAYAWLNSYYVVSSVRTDHSKVIDKTGKILASTSRWTGWVSHVVDLEKEIFEIDSQHQKLIEIQHRLGKGVTIQAFTEEDMFTLESHDPDWPVGRIKREFGLVSLQEYLKEAEMVQDRARRKR